MKLSQIFQGAINESSKARLYKNGIEERERQSKHKQVNEEDPVDVEQSQNNKEQQDTSSKTMEDEKEKFNKGNIAPKDIIEKLNSIRSGKSFKDSQVKKNMDDYISSLSKSEKVALLAFLKGIAQIVTGEVSADQVTQPDAPPANVEMQKDNNHSTEKKNQHVKIKPNIVKNDQEVAMKKGNAGPLPIRPKK